LIKNVKWDQENDSCNTNIYSAKFSLNKNLFAIGSSNVNYVRIYEAEEEYEPILISRSLDKAVYSVDFSSDGKYLAFAGADKYINLIKI